jgi:DNA-binding response OmpR family regulator
MSTTKVVFIVKDDPAINEVLTQFFMGEGHKVFSIYSAFEALKVLKTIRCDLILLDFNLPEMNGNTLLGLFPETARSVPVIGISATSHLFSTHPQLKMIIAKPFDLFGLAEQVTTFIN